MYKQFNYIIQIEASFKTREDRVFNRDILLKKGMMVKRDIEFRDSLKKGNKHKFINKKVVNSGSLEELQKIADNIYTEQIESTIKKSGRERETLKQKYGGYKTKPVKMQKNKTRESDWNRNK